VSAVGPQGPAGTKNLGVWLKAHKLQAGIGAAVLAGGAVLYERSHKSSTAAATAGQPCTDVNGNASVTDSTGACIVNTSAAAATAAAAAPAASTGVPPSEGAYSGTGGYGGDPDTMINSDDSIATLQQQMAGLQATNVNQAAQDKAALAEEANLRTLIAKDAPAPKPVPKKT
jgi:hypothetical protein